MSELHFSLCSFDDWCKDLLPISEFKQLYITELGEKGEGLESE